VFVSMGDCNVEKKKVYKVRVYDWLAGAHLRKRGYNLVLA